MAQQQLVSQAGQLAHSPIMDPQKNPQAVEGLQAAFQQAQDAGQVPEMPQQPQQPVPA